MIISAEPSAPHVRRDRGPRGPRRLELSVPRTDEGAQILAAARRHGRRRVLPGRPASSVLHLLVDPGATRPTGRRRPALPAAPVGTPRVHRPLWHDAAAAVRAVLPGGPLRRRLEDRVADRRGELWVAEDAAGTVLALLVVTVAGELAYLHWLLGAGDDREAAREDTVADQPAIDHLASGVFADLAGRGVRYVLAGAALGGSPGAAAAVCGAVFEPRDVRIRYAPAPAVG